MRRSHPAPCCNRQSRRTFTNAVRELLATPEGKARLAAGDMRLVGAVYDLDSGAVRFFE
jgi:hypothetical protein